MVWQIPDAADTVVCAPDDRWCYHPKHVEQFPDINKLCNVASCWIYIRNRHINEYLILCSIIRKFYTCCGNWRFISVFTRTHNSFLYSIGWVQCTSRHPVLKYIIYCHTFICLYLSNVLFFQVFLKIICMDFSSAMPATHASLLSSSIRSS